MADLSKVLKIGETVAVTDDAGKRVEGIVADLSGSDLVVLERGRRDPASRLTLPESAISDIVLRDSRRNGTLIGAAVGGIPAAVAGTLVMGICESEGHPSSRRPSEAFRSL